MPKAAVLTRTGLRLAHHVFPSQHQRYNLGLNRCWQRVAHILHRTRHRNAQPQGPKIGVHLEGSLHGFRLVDLVVCAKGSCAFPLACRLTTTPAALFLLFFSHATGVLAAHVAMDRGSGLVGLCRSGCSRG